MVERIRELSEYIRNKKHHVFRENVEYPAAEEFARKNVPDDVRVTKRLEEVLRAQKPVLLPGQKILFVRTVKNLPQIYTKEEWQNIREQHFIHEQGRVCNLSPDYAGTIERGLLEEKRRCLAQTEGADEQEKRWLLCAAKSVDAVLELTRRYVKKAREEGKEEEAEILERVPAYGARTFREALQFFRILHFTLWCEGEYHNTAGRLDQYLYPYLKKDLEEGRLTEETAFELVEEFFLTFNLDSDLYPGIQQGDNGQSLMLGGTDKEGKEVFNLLSQMCLKAAGELLMIDPKINLRVSSQTPLSVYEQGTELTRKGLGFPQYSNDDVVIPGLLKRGYALEDARDYTVAACWEFIIPGYGMDIPNIDAVNFPALVNEAVCSCLAECRNYEEFYDEFTDILRQTCRRMNDRIRNLYLVPAPFLSILMKGCIKRRQDISKGNKYNNFGFHGVGISTAVDSLAVIKKAVFEEGWLTPEEAVEIVRGTYDNDEILHRIRYEEPKFGDHDQLTDEIAKAVFRDFAEAVRNLKNERGGCVRAGTGSAMFYLWHAKETGNTLSGHRKQEAFSANYAPELFVKSKGPLSVIASLTEPDLTEVMNGGPVTMEFHSTVFSEEDGTDKVAGLVREFVRHGGHQLQLNSVNRETLLCAQKEPEKYRNLIVRVWGWSAYFVELDREFQDHVIARQEFQV